VAALVRAGATYYSDEYAVLDDRGRVHPYARKLVIRNEDRTERQRCDAKALGGRTGARPLPVGLIAVAPYQPGGRWRPQRLSSGHAALALLANAIPARYRPAAALAALEPAVLRAVALKGRRGEATETAAALLRHLEEIPGR